MRVAKSVTAGSRTWESSLEIGFRDVECDDIGCKLGKSRGESKVSDVTSNLKMNRVNAGMRDRCVKTSTCKVI